MKMESAKLCELLAATFLSLSLLTDPTAACRCFYKNSKWAYCDAEFIIKAQVLDVTEVRFERYYKIKVTEVLKGPASLKDITVLYTASFSALCGYEHPTPFNSDEYLFSVRKFDNILSTSLCEFNRKWKQLSRTDQRGFKGSYRDWCD